MPHTPLPKKITTAFGAKRVIAILRRKARQNPDLFNRREHQLALLDASKRAVGPAKALIDRHLSNAEPSDRDDRPIARALDRAAFKRSEKTWKAFYEKNQSARPVFFYSIQIPRRFKLLLELAPQIEHPKFQSLLSREFDHLSDLLWMRTNRKYKHKEELLKDKDLLFRCTFQAIALAETAGKTIGNFSAADQLIQKARNRSVHYKSPLWLWADKMAGRFSRAIEKNTPSSLALAQKIASHAFITAGPFRPVPRSDFFQLAEWWVEIAKSHGPIDTLLSGDRARVSKFWTTAISYAEKSGEKSYLQYVRRFAHDNGFEFD